MDSIANTDLLGGRASNFVAGIMLEGRTNVPAINPMRSPCSAVSRFVVNNCPSTRGNKRSGLEVKCAVEVSMGR